MPSMSRVAIAILALACILSATTARAADPLPTFASGFLILKAPLGAKPDLTFANGGPANAIVLSGAGPLISYCPQLACVRAPMVDHQRAAALFAAETQDDGHSEEQTVAIETTVKTGFARRWSPNTRFEVGDNVTFSDERNSVYRATTSGVSVATGSGPVGTGTDIVDGTVHWTWVNASAINGKVGLYNELATIQGGGSSWGQANNIHLQPGATPTFNVNTELDFANDSADCVFGIAACYNLLVSTGGGHQSTTGLYVSSDNIGHFATHWGIRVAGDFLASDEDIEDDGGAAVGIGLGLFGGKAHGKAGIQDGSAGAVSFLITGDHTVATIADTSSSPASLSVGGRHTVAGIVERSTSQNGIVLNGRYTGSQIAGKGFRIDPNGALEISSVAASEKMIVPIGTPKSSRSPCQAGEIQFDAAYVYTCVTDNTWRRSATMPF